MWQPSFVGIPVKRSAYSEINGALIPLDRSIYSELNGTASSWWISWSKFPVKPSLTPFHGLDRESGSWVMVVKRPFDNSIPFQAEWVLRSTGIAIPFFRNLQYILWKLHALILKGVNTWSFLNTKCFVHLWNVVLFPLHYFQIITC